MRPSFGVRAKSYRVPSFLVLAIRYDGGHGLRDWYGHGIGLWAWLWWLSCNYSFGMGVGYVHGIWYYGLELWYMGYRRGGLLRDLVLLKVLVWSMSYALLKNLICSNLNYLGVVDTMISKTI